MPRMTKAEKNVLDAEAKQIRLKQYPQRLMDILQQAVDLGEFDITIKDHKIVVADSVTSDEFQFSITFNEDNDFHLGILESSILFKKSLIEEAIRKKEAKKNALAKLTDEEKVLLGLK